MHAGPERNYKSRDPLDVSQGLFKLLPTTSSIVIRIQILLFILFYFILFPISSTVYHNDFSSRLSGPHHINHLLKGLAWSKNRPAPSRQPYLASNASQGHASI